MELLGTVLLGRVSPAPRLVYVTDSPVVDRPLDNACCWSRRGLERSEPVESRWEPLESVCSLEREERERRGSLWPESTEEERAA